MVPEREDILVIVGPTGVGKTALAVEVASRAGFHILSADSRQIYRLMDIGTAKPTPEEREKAPHYLIDLAWPNVHFSVADFQSAGKEKMSELEAQGIPFMIVGGSPFYLYALMGSFFFPTVGADPQLRESLEREAQEKGSDFLHSRLKEVDPISASRIHPNDLKRIIRALEVWELTGRPLSSFTYRKTEVEGFRIVGLRMEKEDLRRRLEKRTEEMFRRGLVEEVRTLLERGYGPELVPMQSIGYKEVIEFLSGALTLEEAKGLIVKRSMQFAKHQMTWFKRDQRIRWIDLEAFPDFEMLAKTLI
ncbi:MAG: tRNA (adenosine(37)-N6)-dimethylallyltransferase MiaA [Caldiserica bacterium]|nr:tRNA (adenosine(37)-N6)-dimethylallyltransferase MiaA [Caldisericota bacterium]